MTTSTGMVLSLSDVAALAGVRRPVVTTWRARSRGTGQPFPEPVGSVAGEERFDVERVVTWLEVTNRGNNPFARADAAAFARLPVAASNGDPDRVAELSFDQLCALLCLKVMTGEALAGRSAADLGRLARAADPGDELLLNEVLAIDDRALHLAAHADQIADAAYSPEEALERLVAARLRRSPSAEAAVALAPSVHDLVRALAQALFRELGADPVQYVDATPGGSDLVASMARAEATSGWSGPPDVLQLVHPGTSVRAVRRRLRVHGVRCSTVEVDADGAFSAPGPVVHVARYPSAAAPGLSTGQMLEHIDDIQLQMDDGQRAVVVAPAAVLCDRLADRRLDDQRDQLVRLGRVRAVVRLPRGLVPRRSRQQLGLWVLGPAHADVGVDQRWTSVADLTDVPLEPVAIENLVGDLVAAMGGRASVRAHAFRYARLRSTTSLLAGRRALVVPSDAVRRPHGPPAAEQVLAVQTLRAALGGDVARDPLADVHVAVGNDDGADAPVTLADAMAQRWVQALPGARVDASHLAGGAVPVIGVEELTGAVGHGVRGIDPLALAVSYPAVRYTEPGDVVFCTSPRPLAVVDEDGGSLVPYPARILRVQHPVAGIVPAVVAHEINELPALARAWRTWAVRRLPPGQLDATVAALAAVDHERRLTRGRATQLDDLARLIIDGVASRAFSLAPGTQTDIHSSTES